MTLSNIEIGTWWPLLLAAGSLVALAIVFIRGQGTLFPDISLLEKSAPAGSIGDRLPLQLGVLISVLLLLSLMDISATRQVEFDRRARDFLVIVDTSRSMRESTRLLRE
ncbi:MAG: hypothetical protein OEM60_15250, partial [Gammaproteobacteria bacterium]|nr:hypothetical protein [Gammaproteobacteria bacterium]